MSKRVKIAKKMDTPSYENKRDIPILEDKVQSNIVEVIIAHDGFEVGQRFAHNESTINKMVYLGFWKRV